MLTEMYIEALPVDEELAGQVWEAWFAGEIGDFASWMAWRLVKSVRVLGSSTLNKGLGG